LNVIVSTLVFTDWVVSDIWCWVIFIIETVFTVVIVTVTKRVAGLSSVTVSSIISPYLVKELVIIFGCSTKRLVTGFGCSTILIGLIVTWSYSNVTWLYYIVIWFYSIVTWFYYIVNWFYSIVTWFYFTSI